MLEISPVLAGTFDSPDYIPATNNIARPTADDTATTVAGAKDIDPRRYSQFDRTATDAGEMTNFSFGDFLDMINPLQHIPVVSSVYRSISGDTINPVSRITGDILYGGALGIASGLLGGIGAAGDAILEAKTGTDSTGNVVAMLFGPNDKAPVTTQLAQNDPTAVVPPTAMPALTAASAISSAQIADTTSIQKQNAATTQAAASSDPATAAITPTKGFPLNRNKMAYGGVMDPSGYQGQNAMLAAAQATNAMRMGSTIYTDPLLSGRHSPAAPPSAPATNPTPAAATNDDNAGSNTASNAGVIATVNTAAASPAVPTAAASVAPQKNPIPQNLIDDVVMMKALNQYRGLAAGPANLGANVNTLN